MEFILKTDLAKDLPATIDFNYEAIKAELDENLARYRGLVFTDEEIPQAKKDRANLNNLVKALDEERMRVKNACLEPYTQFESRINELKAMIKAPSDEIDAKVKQFEDAKKSSKRDAIRRFYADNINGMEKILPLERIFNPRWDNTTYSLITITQEIMAAIERAEADLKTISSLQSEHELAIKDKYLQTLDLGAALAEKARLDALREVTAAQEARARAEHENVRVNAEAAQRAAEAVTEAQPEEAEDSSASEVPAYANEAPAAPQYRVIDFRIKATDAQLAALKEFLITNHIPYGRVPYAVN